MIKKIQVTIPAQTFQIDIEIDGVTPLPVDPPVDPPAPPVKKSAMIGVNAFPWNPLQKLKPFNVRLYIDAGWIWQPGGLYINPMFQAEAQTIWGMMDDYFNEAARLGIDVAPCVLRCPDWYNGRTENNGTKSNNFPPIKAGKDRKDPASYQEYAEFWKQLAMRYGTRTFTQDKLRVDTTPRWPNDTPNVKKSGLGAMDLDKGGVRIKFFEIGNEWDRWWDVGGANDAAYMKPAEHAALFVAAARAIKSVSDIEPVMGGITGFDMKYLKEFVETVEKLAPGEKLLKRLVLHHYSHLGNILGKWPPTWYNGGACMPSEDKNFASINQIVDYAKGLGMKVWVNEFGCDSEGPSWMHIEGSRYGMSDEEAQGKQIVETFKAYGMADVERAYSFMFANEPYGTGLWQRCGLVTSKPNYDPKPAYNAVLKLIQETGDTQKMARSIKKNNSIALPFKMPMK